MGSNPDLLVLQLRAVLQNPEAFAAQRQEIMNLSRQAAAMLEEPFEMLQRVAYSPLALITARIAQEHRIFETLVRNPDAPTSIEDLSKATAIIPIILQPILDYLTTQSMVQETSPGQYLPTKFSHMLLAPLFTSGIGQFHDVCLPAFNALNVSLSHPADPRTPFEIGHSSPVDFYTWLETHPVQSVNFHRFMEAQFALLPTWLSVVQFDKEYAQSTSPETPIFVDVGGGKGQQCVALQEKFFSLEGRIILQDRPAVLEKAIVGDSVERMPYDYLVEQPVKGARVYYFRQIFHNHNDETCHRILQSHLPAMDSSSVLLIDDKVLPDEKSPGGAVEYTAGLSVAMLVMFNAMERRESQWRKLLGDAGYKIKAIKKFTDFEDCIIVATRK